MKMNEFAFAISWLHFPTLGKCSKAINEVQANGATENTWPKEGGSIRPKYTKNPLRYDHGATVATDSCDTYNTGEQIVCYFCTSLYSQL